MRKANIVKADFAHNYFNACGYNDTGLEKDLLMNEIAALIDEKPLTVIQTMDAAGYKFIGQTRGDLVKAVTTVLDKSSKFATMLATLIALNNGMVTYEQISSLGKLSLNDMGAAPIQGGGELFGKIARLSTGVLNMGGHS